MVQFWNNLFHLINISWLNNCFWKLRHASNDPSRLLATFNRSNSGKSFFFLFDFENFKLSIVFWYFKSNLSIENAVFSEFQILKLKWIFLLVPRLSKDFLCCYQEIGFKVVLLNVNLPFIEGMFIIHSSFFYRNSTLNNWEII